MKTINLTALALATGLLTTGAFAQNALTLPTTPAPTVATDPQPAPFQTVYAPQLPSVAELTKVAAAQGLAIKQIIQSARELSVTYQSTDGQTKTVSYQLLANAGVNPVAAPAPAEVYMTPPPTAYYYDPYYPYYYPGYWYPPVAFRIGFGWGGGRGYGHGHRW